MSLPVEICEYCQKGISARAHAYILDEKIACRLCYQRGGSRTNCTNCGEMMAEQARIYKWEGRAVCHLCYTNLQLDDEELKEQMLEELGDEPANAVQRAAAQELGVDLRPGVTKTEIAELIHEAIEQRRDNEPATEKQRHFATSLGLTFLPEITKCEMSELLDAAVTAREQRGVPVKEMKNVLEKLTELATAHRLARMVYYKIGESSPIQYLVEPYSTKETFNHELIVCWQIEPPTDGADSWRSFRLDRIVGVADGGGPFSPRIPITLALH